MAGGRPRVERHTFAPTGAPNRYAGRPIGMPLGSADGSREVQPGERERFDKVELTLLR